MAENKIRLLLIHPFPETSAYISALLGLERDVLLLGTVHEGAAGLKQALEQRPDVILVGSDLADVESPALVRQLVSQLPRTGVIALVTDDEPEELRRYMQAGARSFLILPFSSDQLVSSIREVYKRMQSVRVAPEPRAAAAAAAKQGKVLAVFSPKGGVGKSTIAVNAAVALQRQSGYRVALLDAGFSFGDLHLFLNIRPDRTIVDFIERGPDGDLDTLQQVLKTHSSGLAFLPRPVRPEHAEMVTADNLRRVLDLLTSAYDVVVLDCPPSYDERNLMLLDRADAILLVVTPDVATLYNTTAFLNLAQALGYARERITVVVNRYDSHGSVAIKEIEDTLAHPVAYKVPSRWRDLSTALNAGEPIAASHPNADISRVIAGMAEATVKKLDAD
ncbi:MAG: AAA family ATPase [Chloroflexota bacterium]